MDSSRRYTRILLILFLCTLPLVNPIVHGDGVGYYAYVRAPLIEHNLRFEEDWRHANLNFSQSRTMLSGQLLPNQYTETGYVSNLFTVGPALLWAPFLVAAHGVVLLSDARGAHIPADGFSFPYILAMALGTAFYGFLGLLLSYSLARKYVAAHWAFLATLGIWGASSLPVYMYFNAAWSRAHSSGVGTARVTHASASLCPVERGIRLPMGRAPGSPARPDLFFGNDLQPILLVPRQLTSELQKLLFKRNALMKQIEERDLPQLKENLPPP